MADRLKPDGEGQPPIEGAEDARVHRSDKRNSWRKGEEAYPGGGVNGPLKDDPDGYKTHYGESAYGGGQKRFGKQPVGPTSGADAQSRKAAPGDDPAIHDALKGRAGSRGIIPGAGADKGPPDEA